MTVPDTANLATQLRRIATAAATGPLPDAELVRRFADSHDQAAFEVLVWRHGPMVWAACRRVAAHCQDAEDAFQATFLVLVRRLAAIRNPDLLGNWLYGVAVRVAMRARRSAAHTPPRGIPDRMGSTRDDEEAVAGFAVRPAGASGHPCR